MLLIGDGAAQFTVQELGTLARERLTPVVVVADNDGYTVERAIHGPDAFHNDIVGWRWLDVPRALGVDNVLAFRARTYCELDDAFTAAAAAQDRRCSSRPSYPRWISRSCSPNWRSLRRPRTPAGPRP